MIWKPLICLPQSIIKIAEIIAYISSLFIFSCTVEEQTVAFFRVRSLAQISPQMGEIKS